MTKQMSFTRLEKEFMSILRNKINISEDKVDLENHFAQTVVSLLNRAFIDKKLKVELNDVEFNPKGGSYFTINSHLLNSEVFRETWGNSNLPQVLKKFAESTHRRYLHLNKHPEKTEKKIRN